MDVIFGKEQAKDLHTLSQLATTTQREMKGAKIMASIVQAQVVLQVPEAIGGDREISNWRIMVALSPAIMGTIIAEPRNIKLFLRATFGGSARAAREFIKVAKQEKAKAELKQFMESKGITKDELIRFSE